MPDFSRRSRSNLESCHPDLVRLFEAVVKEFDCTVLEGQRTPERQEELVRLGMSKTMNSKHLTQPLSYAVDVVPYPIAWDRQAQERMRFFGGYVLGLASQLGIRLRWGGDWNGSAFSEKAGLRDQNFFDLPHFELLT